jgi:hypothetical protein
MFTMYRSAVIEQLRLIVLRDHRDVGLSNPFVRITGTRDLSLRLT